MVYNNDLSQKMQCLRQNVVRKYFYKGKLLNAKLRTLCSEMN